ncbi:hypothetical protein N9C35_04050 [Flavobacteriaceae bacterium]|nr:hypothetical protein [Flavobacteriaceae bacterium]
MKKFRLPIFIIILVYSVCVNASDELPNLIKDITDQMPVISLAKQRNYKKVPDVAQYKNANWDNLIGIANNISLSEAFDIADANPKITFFFYTKGYQMVLEKPNGSYRVFKYRDAVFFSGDHWFGSAPGLADGYLKKKKAK